MLQEIGQIVNSLPHFTHLTTVSLAFNRSNFFEPQAGQIGQDLIFSITPQLLIISLILKSTHIPSTYQEIEFIK